MAGKVIGISMNYGYAGTVTRTADTIIQNRLAAHDIAFGTPVVLTSSNTFDNVGGSTTADDIAGIAVREVVQANQYDPQANSDYLAGKPCDVLTRGQVSVKCQRGTPTSGGDVYVRIALNGSYPTCVIGGFEASSDSTNSIKVSNMQWTTGMIDSNLITELTVMTRNRG